MNADRLPRLKSGRMFIGDGGLETTMMFDEGIELPCFASFLLLESPERIAALRRYYEAYLAVAHRHRVGFTLDTPTWRANADWGARLGYSRDDLDRVNRRAVGLALELRAAHESSATPIPVCGTIGPRSDAYHPSRVMSPAEAQAYHSVQIQTFRDTPADMVSAYTLAYPEEAKGIVRAAAEAEIPVSISFTVETDGRLPDGHTLHEAIDQVDTGTGAAAAYFMINCAHPSHFAAAVQPGGSWLARVGGARANASRKSHAELDQATTLDRGDPGELAEGYRRLQRHVPGLRIIGGCCGTNQGHVDRICEAWLKDESGGSDHD